MLRITEIGSNLALMIPAHDQTVTNHYVLHYPEHAPREGDPNYAAFNAYHRANHATAVCWRGELLGFDSCADAQGKPMLDQPGHPGIELHHKVIEFATLNSVDLATFTRTHPTITSQSQLQAWAESPANFVWLCAKHHRGVGGVHHASASDWEAEAYIRDLIGPFK